MYGYTQLVLLLSTYDVRFFSVFFFFFVTILT